VDVSGGVLDRIYWGVNANPTDNTISFYLYGLNPGPTIFKNPLNIVADGDGIDNIYLNGQVNITGNNLNLGTATDPNGGVWFGPAAGVQVGSDIALDCPAGTVMSGIRARKVRNSVGADDFYQFQIRCN
jgi:hypothetical protein